MTDKREAIIQKLKIYGFNYSDSHRGEIDNLVGKLMTDAAIELELEQDSNYYFYGVHEDEKKS
jgi:hypothetical protein